MSGEAKVIGGSLRMREPEELLGLWTLETADDRCVLRFDAARIETANGWRLVDPDRCLTRMIGDAVAWRPAPEGIELAAADRLTLLLFTATGDASAEATLPGGGTARLRPVAPAR